MKLDGLKIGLVGPLPPPSGGMANQTRQLARLLAQEGAAVELVQVNAPYRPHWIAMAKGLRALFRLVPYLLALWRAAGRVKLFHVMANSGWSWHLFAAPAIWIAHFRGIPVVVNYRGGEAQAFLERSSATVKFSLDRASSLVVPSRFLQEVFSRFGIAPRVVPNIVDLERFSEGPAPAPNPPAAPHLVVTRNLERLYDVGTALRAFEQVRRHYPSARMTVAGSGPERDALERLCRELDISGSVTFTGRLDSEEIAALYRTADLMLNPSLADNMPNSIIEAWACAVPVVSTRVGGIPHMVVEGENAILVAPARPDALAQAALDVLGNPSLARSLARAGRSACEKLTWTQIGPQWATVYRDATHVPTKTIAEAKWSRRP